MSARDRRGEPADAREQRVAWEFFPTLRVTPKDPLILGGALVTLVTAGLLASAVPARRAARVDPLVALRQESTRSTVPLAYRGKYVYASLGNREERS